MKYTHILLASFLLVSMTSTSHISAVATLREALATPFITLGPIIFILEHRQSRHPFSKISQ